MAAADSTAVPRRRDRRDSASDGRVPDTLDLAEHGRLALGGMLGSLDPAIDYECYFLTFFDVHPAYMVHWSSMVSGVMPKYVEALPLLRSDDRQPRRRWNQDGFMEAMLKNMAEDGLVYDRPARPPLEHRRPIRREGLGRGLRQHGGQRPALAGLTYWHQWTGEAKWKELAKKTAERMLESGHRPGRHGLLSQSRPGERFQLSAQSGWTNTDPPKGPSEGVEGRNAGLPLAAAARVRPLLCPDWRRAVPGTLAEVRQPGDAGKVLGGRSRHTPGSGAERGHFQGHFHGNLAAVRGLLDYALVANDSRLMLFARDAYDWARQKGIPRLGLFPARQHRRLHDRRHGRSGGGADRRRRGRLLGRR